MTALRRLACAALCVAAPVILCPAADARAPAARVAPLPQLRMSFKAVRLHGQARFEIFWIEVRRFGGLRFSISCGGGCLRYAGPIKRVRPAPGYILFRNVDWLIRPHQGIRVVDYGAGVIGRYKVVTLSQKRPTIRTRATGCVDSTGATVIACPAGVSNL